MKSFKGIVSEATKPKSRVILFGRMNPITSGHEENVEAAHKIAQKHGADLHVIASHSQDAKKNPLTAEHKLKHLKRAFGHLSNTEVKTSSKEAPTILHHAAQAHAAGVKHLIIAGGGDRAGSYHKLLHDYNGVKGKAHGHYKFDKISIENTGERKAGVSGTDMRKHASAGHYDKFRAGLPSKIRSNDKHSQELYQHVRQGMGVHEEVNREEYVAGRVLKIGESVIDTHTGMQGRIVYRGPTYVTVQLDENISVKRWLAEVDVLTEADMPHTDAPMISGFKDFLGRPADFTQRELQRLQACPAAQQQFSGLLEDPLKDQGLVLSALDSTAKYLAIETFAQKNLDSVNDHAISEFNQQVRAASQKLHALGVLPDHQAYIQTHVETMMDIIHQHNAAHEQSGDQYMVKEQTTKVQDPDISGHLDDKDLSEIEKSIDKLEWQDIEHLYDEQEHEEAEEEFELSGAMLDEDLTVAQRMKKKVDFMKTRARRQIARRVALHRASTPAKLKKRAIIHAKSLLAKKIYRGRNRSELSVGEKNRLEGILKKSKAAVVRISNRLLPKMRELENKRLSRLREEQQNQRPNQATDLIYDGEEHSANTVAQNDTDTTGNETLAHVKAHLSGDVAPPQHTDVKAREHVKRMRKFRQMED